MSRIFNIKVVEQPEARFTIKESHLFVFIGLLFLLQLVVGLYSWVKIRRISSENIDLREENQKFETDNQTLKAEKQLLEESNVGLQDQLNNLLRYPENKLRAIGIDTEKKKIIKQTPNPIQWEQDQVKYSLKSIYLTPEVADLTEYRRYVQIQTPNYLMVEMQIEDLRYGGATRVLNPYLYLLLRLDSGDFEPFISKKISINPQESLTYYSGFYVQPDLLKFMLLAGEQTNREIINIDFSDSKSQSLFGVFKIDSGFTPEYYE